MVFWKYHGIFKTTVPRDSYMNRCCYTFCKIGKFTFSKGQCCKEYLKFFIHLLETFVAKPILGEKAA